MSNWASSTSWANTHPLVPSHPWTTLQACTHHFHAIHLRTWFLTGFIAYVLTTLPASSLHDVTFRIQGDRRSLASVGALYGARVPPVPIAHVTELPEGFVKQTFLQKKFDQGRSSSGWDNYIDKDVPENADSGNKAWEGHKWRSVEEVLGL